MAAIVLLAGASDAGARPAATAQRRPAAQDGDELVWLLNRHAHGQWELFYAYPDDHYRNITFRCGPHEGRVHARLTIDEGEGLDHPIGARLRTGFSLIGFAERGQDNVQREYDARAIMVEGGALIRDRPIPVTDPVLTLFARNGLLTRDHNLIGAASDGERADIAQFMRHCAAR